MRDALPRSGPWVRERGILNLDADAGPGTHWTAYDARPGQLNYFDSYGLSPPQELVEYLRKRHPDAPLRYSSFRVQSPGDGPICGQLCAKVLRQLAEGRNFLDILMQLQF